MTRPCNSVPQAHPLSYRRPAELIDFEGKGVDNYLANLSLIIWSLAVKKVHHVLFAVALSLLSLPGMAAADNSGINLSDVSCSEYFCAAVGNESSEPVILQANASETEWELVRDSIGAPEYGSLSMVECSTAGCVAVGWSYEAIDKPFFIHSAMRGAPWEASVIDTPLSTYYASISCSERNCVAVGDKQIIYSTDVGATWANSVGIVDLPAAPYTVLSIDKVSCVDRFCILLGRGDRFGGHQYPLVAQSNDAGMTWHYVPSISDNDMIVISDISCGEYICAVAGVTDVGGQWAPKVYQTRDMGRSWTAPQLPQDLGVMSVFVDCAERSCTMTAMKNTVAENFIYETTDGGITWNKRFSPYASTLWGFQGSLAQQQSALIGNTEQFLTGTNTFVIMNRGLNDASWTVAPEAIEMDGLLYSVSCSGARCAAIGTRIGSHGIEPVMMQSIREGAWEPVNLP
jgi:photosystem II stability/assembly factor-like uncharacterized protein